jgi:hypothetical protein
MGRCSMIPQSDVRSALLTPEQRLTEIARILASAILRLRCRAALPSASSGGPDIRTNSDPNCLEVLE